MGKNIKKIQGMLLGNHNPTIQVGFGDQESDNRSVGDKWTDSDGYEWIQHEGYREKVRTMPSVGIFSKQCKDCKKNCVQGKDKDTFNRMSRCYYCQINFEVDLKRSRIGENNNKHYFWVKLMMLKKWETIDKEIEELALHNRGNSISDAKLINSLANYNQELTKESIKKTTT